MMIRSGSVARRPPLDLLDHELGRDELILADVMGDAARQQLISIRSREAAACVSAMVRWTWTGSPSRRGIEHDRQLADGAHVDGDVDHFRQSEVACGDAFEPAERGRR